MEVHLLDHRNLEDKHAYYQTQLNLSMTMSNHTSQAPTSISLVVNKFSRPILPSTSSSFLETTSSTDTQLQYNEVFNTTELLFKYAQIVSCCDDGSFFLPFYPFHLSSTSDMSTLDRPTSQPNDESTSDEQSPPFTPSKEDETTGSSDMYTKLNVDPDGGELKTESTARLDDKHMSEEKSSDWIFGSLSTPQAVRVMEQVLLLTVIVGRWLLPKGDVTRDELSQLLLVNIGMAADIIELFETFGEEKVNKKRLLTIITLLVWQMSMLQFTLTKTATKGRKQRAGFTSLDRHQHKGSMAAIVAKDSPKVLCCAGGCMCCETELWAIFTSLLLQDLPFFTLRMVLICYYNVNTYTIIFFTSKNALVLSLQLYRISVVFAEHQGGKKRRATTDSTLGSLSHLAMDVTIAPGGPPLMESTARSAFVNDHTLQLDKMSNTAAVVSQSHNHQQHVLLRQTVPSKEAMLPPVLRRAVVAAEEPDEATGCAKSPVCRWLPRREDKHLTAGNDAKGYQAVKPKLKLKRRSHGSTSVLNCSLPNESEMVSRHHSVIAIQNAIDLESYGVGEII